MSARKISYRIGVTLRIVLIISFGFAAVVIGSETPFWLVSVWLGVLALILIIELIRFHERSKKVLKEFLHFIDQDDFTSLSIADEKDKELQATYQKILDKFRHLRIEKETHYQYLQRLIEHVDTALICFDNSEIVHLSNHAANELLGIYRISDLRSLKKIDKDLVSRIRNMKAGQREMVRLIRNGRILNLSMRGTEFKQENNTYRIVSFHDIKPELDEQEVDSWQKLVRVLTHEIMNSTIPITNLVGFAREFLVDDEGKPKKYPALRRKKSMTLLKALPLQKEGVKD